MCGLFGYVGSRPVDVDALAAVAIDTEVRRGGHAFGFAWIDHRWRLRHFKARGRLADNLGDLDALRGARLVLGHCRYATHGKPEANVNNHPHPCDGGWFAHNGQIPGHWRIAARHGVQLTSECDSELVARLIEVSPRNGILARFKHAVEQAIVKGTEFAGLGLWRKPMGLYIARAGKPLHGVLVKQGTYIASLDTSLRDLGTPSSFADDTVRVLTLSERRGKLGTVSNVLNIDLKEGKKPKAPSGDLFAHLPNDESFYTFAQPTTHYLTAPTPARPR